MQSKCPICESQESSEFYIQRSGYNLGRCTNCKLVFLEDSSQSVNDEFFDDASKTLSKKNQNKDAIEYWSYPNYYETHQGVFNNFFHDRWEKIKNTGKKVDSLLDIGCGYGFFVDYIQKYIPHVQGIDLNGKVVEYAREVKGLNVEECAVEDMRPDQQFDCVVMCDVIEHVKGINELLESCHSVLTDGGVLYIQVPNLVGLKIPQGHSWGLPHHIWQFSPPNLKLLLEKKGFKVHNWYTGVLGVIGAYERGGPTLCEKFTWFIAKRLKLGNRLQMVATKA